MRRIFKTALLLFFLLLPYSLVAGEELTPRWGVGLNYPGAGIRYFLNDKLSLELRGQFADDIVVGGLRGNYYFNPGANTLLFMGVESDYVSFKGTESKGSGIAEELYLGMEFFLWSHFSLQVDFGPAFIALKDNDSSLSVDGLEYVVNFGLNWYFGGQPESRRPKLKKQAAKEEEIAEEVEEEQGSDE
jgi:hypothetical protein